MLGSIAILIVVDILFIAAIISKAACYQIRAFNPDDVPYTDRVDKTIRFPADLIGEGDTYHICTDEVSTEKSHLIGYYPIVNSINDRISIRTDL
jgi:hypothetical protein